nr:hypothetical protein [Streptomyces sindenensis]
MARSSTLTTEDSDMVQGFSKEPGTHGPLTNIPPEGQRKITR